MSFVDTWYERIESDLVSFIDPGTNLAMDKKGNVIDAVWSQRRKDVSATFVVSDIASIEVKAFGKTYSYRSFFASEAMADIMGMAKSTVLLHKSHPYVETQAVAPSLLASEREGSATNIISKLVTEKDDENILTTFVMVTGEAGAGKTSVLKELVRRQADRYARGQSDFVYLYIDAQGRALARFNEALATELNDLRMQLPIYAVPPMVKLGLIVPVVDGFDELLGVGGYDDAFSSISSFIEELGGKGAIVASARSTYYEQEFLSRASRASQFGEQSWRLSSVEVKAWSDAEIKEFVRLEADGDVGLADSLFIRLKKIFSGENAVLGEKPLFVVRVGGYILSGSDLSGEGRILEQLMDAFIVREQREKLLSKSGKPILTTGELRSLCADLAEEMWNLGTRELDKLTVRELADLAMSDSSNSASDKSTVIERMPSMAFLQPGEAQGSVAFEHELFFDLFLASRLAEKIHGSSPGLPLLMGRSTMPEALAEGVADEIFKLSKPLDELAKTLGKAGGSHAAKQQFVKENCGHVMGFLIKYSSDNSGAVDDVHFSNMTFPGSSFHNVTIRNSLFSQVEFKRIDAVGLVLEKCTGDGVLFEAPLISSSTRLDIDGITAERDFVGIRRVDDDASDGLMALYDPRLIHRYLKEAGLPSAQADVLEDVRKIDPAVVRLVERLAKAYSRCNPICAQDNFLTGIFDDPSWPEVKRIALASNIIKEENRQAHGSRREFFRKMVQPDDLLSGLRRTTTASSAVVVFWDQLEAGFPSPG
jgi:hypothetical protein